MLVSSRTPEGDPNRCAVCGHRCRVEPSCLSPDAPCPRCGHLLWFPADAGRDATDRPAEPSIPDYRPKRPQNAPTVREPNVQAQRLVRRLVRRAEGRFGWPSEAVAAALGDVREPRRAERLLALMPAVESWDGLLAAWLAEAGRVAPV